MIALHADYLPFETSDGTLVFRSIREVIIYLIEPKIDEGVVDKVSEIVRDYYIKNGCDRVSPPQFVQVVAKVLSEMGYEVGCDSLPECSNPELN